MENVNLTKTKRLIDHPSSQGTTRHVSQMSENSLKRLEEARHAYLSGQYSSIQKHRQIKPKIKPTKPIISIEPQQSIQTDQLQIIHEHLDDKCVGTETNESVVDIEQTDEAIQADLPSSENLNEIEDEKIESIEVDDKTTETDLVLNVKIEDIIEEKPQIIVEPNPQIETEIIIESNPQIENEIIIESNPQIENEIIVEPNPQIENEIIIEPSPQIENEIELINDDDTKTILSSSESSMSISEQLLR